MGKEDAILLFSDGLNVVSGVTDSGKSYAFQCIDFMFGGARPPKPIPEAEGYTTVHLGVRSSSGQEYELRRSLSGGAFEVITGEEGESSSVLPLAEVHSDRSEQNISRFLLRLCDLDGKRVRKNSENETQNLTFRGVSKLIAVDEESIIKERSPALSGDSVSKTAEQSTLKLLLTGVDDSSLVQVKKKTIARAELIAQSELLDRMIAPLAKGLVSMAPQGELVEQDASLSSAIEDASNEMQSATSEVNKVAAQREIRFVDQQKHRARLLEVESMIARFAMLREKYDTDHDRLLALAEAGDRFESLSAPSCVLCGSALSPADGPSPERLSLIITAALAEAQKIHARRSDLGDTLSDLEGERWDLTKALAKSRQDIDDLERELRIEVKRRAGDAEARYIDLSTTRLEVRRKLSVYERHDELVDLREEILAQIEELKGRQVERAGFPTAAAGELSKAFKAVLTDWKIITGTEDVYFNEQSFDMVIGNQGRETHGKGWRAITHAAFNVALMRTTAQKKLPHATLVILDSPLVTLREAPSDEGISDEIKNAFYRSLAKAPVSEQIIVFENDDPEPDVVREINIVLFDGPERPGFFPVSKVARPAG